MKTLKRVSISVLLLAAACGAPRSFSTTVPPQSLILASKAGHVVTVRAIELATGIEETLFTYREGTKARHSGNLWEEMRPSIALSPEERRIAFAGEDGLFVYDISTGTTEPLITKLGDLPGETAGARWSEPLESTFGIHAPAWSGDGRYISFMRSLYEGNAYGFYDTREDRYFVQAGLPVSYMPVLTPLAWAPTGATTAVGQREFDVGYGVFVSEVDNPATTSLVEYADVMTDVALGPGGEDIAVLSGDTLERQARLTVLTRSGEAGPIVDGDGTKSDVVADLRGDLWWIEGASMIGPPGIEIAPLAPGFEWRFVSVGVNGVELAGHDRRDERARFVSVFLETGTIAVRHEATTDFVTYAGIVMTRPTG